MFHRNSLIPQSILDSDLGRFVPRRELEIVARHGTEIRLPAGRTIMTEDSPGRECMLVIDGALEVSRRGVHLAQIGSGGFVGEMALLTHEARSATVTVTEPTLAYAFSRRDFAGVMEDCPVLARHIRDLAADRALATAA